MLSLPDLALALRYHYYVKSAPLIADDVYDRLEARARKEAPDGHPILRPGCDVEDFYPENVKVISASEIIKQAELAMEEK